MPFIRMVSDQLGNTTPVTTIERLFFLDNNHHAFLNNEIIKFNFTIESNIYKEKVETLIHGLLSMARAPNIINMTNTNGYDFHYDNHHLYGCPFIFSRQVLNRNNFNGLRFYGIGVALNIHPNPLTGELGNVELKYGNDVLCDGNPEYTRKNNYVFNFHFIPPALSAYTASPLQQIQNQLNRVFTVSPNSELFLSHQHIMAVNIDTLVIDNSVPGRPFVRDGNNRFRNRTPDGRLQTLNAFRDYNNANSNPVFAGPLLPNIPFNKQYPRP